MEEGSHKNISPFKVQRYEYTPSRKSSGNWGKFLIVIIIFLLLGSLIFTFTKFSDFTKKDQQKKSLTPTPTEFVFPTDTPTPTPKESPTPKAIVSTPTITKGSIDKATGLDRSKLVVVVLNGSGQIGAASKASEALKNLGYQILRIGNAKNYTYENMVIEIKNTKKSYLNLLKKDLAEFYTIGSSSATLTESLSEDAVVIVGKE